MFHANIFMLPMFERIKRIFSGLNRSAPSPAALLSKASVDNSVPQFPPFPRGFPVIDPADVLKTQSELLVSIRDMLGFSLDEHARIVEPILLRFASYAHLLPASQIHHHRGAGGLLRHGLEVAFWAGQASKAVVFPFDGAPRFKHEHRARWRLAYFLAGLTHDVGKPVTDMQITDASGQHIWEPYGPSLMQWSVANDIDRYYIRWVASRRHKQHESGGLLIANRILGEQTINYLSKHDKQLMPALTKVMSGQMDPGDRLARVVMDSDRHSVMLDMRANRLEVNGYSQGIPVEQHVVEVIRKLTTQRVWRINTSDAVVWNLPEGPFIQWDEATKDINRTITQMGIPGIPKDAQVLADILIERGIALPYETITPDGEVLNFRYHRLTWTETDSAAKPPFVTALRFSHLDYVFEGLAAPVLHGKVAIESENPTVVPAQPITVSVVEPSAHRNDEDKAEAAQQPVSESSEDLAFSSPGDSAGPSASADKDSLDALNKKGPSVQCVPLDLDSLVNVMIEREGPVPPLPVTAELETIGSERVVQPDEENSGATASLSNTSDTSLDKASESTVNSEHDSEKQREKASKPTDKPRSQIEPAIVLQGSVDPPERMSAATGRAFTFNAPELQENAEPTPLSDTAEPRVMSDPFAMTTGAMGELFGKLGEAGDYLSQLVGPIIEGKFALGQELLKLNNQLVIAYPTGLERIGNPLEVMSVLTQSGVLIGDALFPAKKVHDIDGQRVLKLDTPIAKVIVDAIEQIADLSDPFAQDSSFENTKSETRIETETTHTDPTKHRTDRLPDELSVQHIEDESAGFDPSYFDNSYDPDDVANPVPPSPAAVPDQVQQALVMSHDCQDSEDLVPSIPAPQPQNSILDSAKSELSDRKAKKPVIKGPPDVTVETVLDELIEMMKEGQGRWLSNPVQREGDYLVVPYNETAHSIVLEYPSRLTLSKIRMKLGMPWKGLSVNKKQLYLFIGESR